MHTAKFARGRPAYSVPEMRLCALKRYLPGGVGVVVCVSLREGWCGFRFCKGIHANMDQRVSVLPPGSGIAGSPGLRLVSSSAIPLVRREKWLAM